MDRPRYARRISARALEDRTAVAAQSFYRFEAKAKDNEDETPDELWIYDEIGFSFWDEGVTAAGFAKDLAQLKGKRLTLRVNSPGGDVFDGLAIKNLLADHGARITAKVDGLAASIASVIVMAADEVVMGANSQMMIHDASGFAMGNSDDMLDMANLLDMISDNISTVYAARAGGEPKDWRKVMKGEKWYTADEAVEAGLADRVAVRAKTEDDGDAEDKDLKTCPDCKGKGCDKCDGTGKCEARYLRTAAKWCRALFPGHEDAAERFENAAKALAPLPTIGDSDTPAGARTGPLEPLPGDVDTQSTPLDGAGVEPPSGGVSNCLPPPAPAAVGPAGDAALTPSASPADGDQPAPFAWDPSALTAAVQSAVAPPEIDLGDWRAWFSEAPAMRTKDHNAPVVLPAYERPAPAPEPVANPLAEMIRLTTTTAANNRPAVPVAADRNAPVDLGPPPVRPADPTPAETPRNVLADMIGAAVTLTANDQPAPELLPQPAPELPEAPPIRLNVADVRRAIREARF